MTRVPISWSMIGVVLALAVQTCGIVWWAGTVQQRVAALEATVVPMASAADEASATVARLDERTEAIREGVTRIERQLEARGDR